jgi:hypothetical protein
MPSATHQQENNLAMSKQLKISPIRHKVTRRFYEPLLLLHALSPIRGGRIKSEIIPDDPESNHIQLRRSFTNSIAYICAYQKGSDYVTAAALEKTPQGVVVWLCANADVEEGVVTFLEEILACVYRVVEKDSVEDLHQEASLATQRLESMIVDFQAPRLNVYRAEIIKSCILPCQELITDYLKSNGKFSIAKVCCHHFTKAWQDLRTETGVHSRSITCNSGSGNTLATTLGILQDQVSSTYPKLAMILDTLST